MQISFPPGGHQHPKLLVSRKSLILNDLRGPGRHKPLIIKNLWEQTHQACDPLTMANPRTPDHRDLRV